MAKIPYSKLALKKQEDKKIINIANNQVEVKQYLPIEDKLRMITSIVADAADGNNFCNALKLDAFINLHIVFEYTNISFTDKQKEDLSKLYDNLESNGIFSLIIEAIPESEYDTIYKGTYAFCEDYYNSYNSLRGVLEEYIEDYAELEKSVKEAGAELSDSNKLGFLREVMSKLG